MKSFQFCATIKAAWDIIKIFDLFESFCAANVPWLNYEQRHVVCVSV